MESTIGYLLLVALFGFAFWIQKRDEKVHGQPTPKDKRRTFAYSLAWLSGLVVIFSFSFAAYVFVGVSFYILSQFLTVGEGKRGHWRQFRDGGLLGWIFSLPVCFVMHMSKLQT